MAGVLAAGTTLSGQSGNFSPDRGEQVFQACLACHTTDRSDRPGVGPDLWGVVGRKVASVAGFTRYSAAMSSAGGNWTPERLDRFLRQPMAEIPGTAMVFPGIPGAQDRADLIAWLNRNSDAPLDTGAIIGSDAVEADRETPAGAAGVAAFGVLVREDGVRETWRHCTACHSERLIAQQGLTRDGWEETLEYMVEEQGMAPIEEADRERVLAYLSTHYGIDRPNFPTQ